MEHQSGGAQFGARAVRNVTDNMDGDLRHTRSQGWQDVSDDPANGIDIGWMPEAADEYQSLAALIVMMTAEYLVDIRQQFDPRQGEFDGQQGLLVRTHYEGNVA